MKTAQKNLGCIGIEYRSEDRPAIIDLWNPDAPRQLSYPEFHDACDAMARGFVKRGFVNGDRIGILCVNRFEFLVVFFGAIRAVVAPVPIGVLHPEDTIRWYIECTLLKFVFFYEYLLHQ